MPQNRTGNNRPYQFEMPVDLYKRARVKSSEYGIDLAPFMRIAIEQFVNTPVETLLEQLKQYNTANNAEENTNNVRTTNTRSGRKRSR